MSGLKTPPEKLAAIADYWRKNPEARDADICVRFRVCCKTAKKVRVTIWSEDNPRPISQRETRFDALRRRLFPLLLERPEATIVEIAEELGASREWVRMNAPSGHFSRRRSGKFDALRRRLLSFLIERPEATLDELSEEIGASREWIRSNAPSGHFSKHERGFTKKNEATTPRRKKTERTRFIRRDGLRISKRPKD